MSRVKITTLEAVDPASATGRTAELFEGAKAQVGMVPNMYANMANLPEMYDTYAFGYEQFRASGVFSSQEQEVVFLTISKLNSCEYCMGAHSMIADRMSGVDAATLAEVRDDQPITDRQLAALADFTRVMVETAGNPSKEAVANFRAAGYEDKAMLAIILALSVKIISNFSNHLFATPLDDAFSAYSWEAK